MASFSVVALMKEDGAVVRRFIDYYQKIGASRILIFYDGATDHLAKQGVDSVQLKAQGVEVVACDDGFWLQETGKIPENIQERLRTAFAIGHVQCEADWMLVCDADEFVIDRMPVSKFLDKIPKTIDSVTIPPAEAVWGPGEDITKTFGSTWFRRPASANIWRELWIYGPLGILFRRGVLGHSSGKQFVRRGATFDLIHQHYAIRDGHRISVPAVEIDPQLSTVELAHFDAVSYARWYEKFRRRVLNDTASAMKERSRRRQVQIFLFKWTMHLGGKSARRFCSGLYALSPRQIRALKRHDLIFQEDIFKARSVSEGYSAGQASTSRA